MTGSGESSPLTSIKSSPEPVRKTHQQFFRPSATVSRIGLMAQEFVAPFFSENKIGLLTTQKDPEGLNTQGALRCLVFTPSALRRYMTQTNPNVKRTPTLR